MADSSEPPADAYNDALRALGGLINQRKRADGTNWGDAFALMHEYVKILELQEVIHGHNIIHVAGTKGKGSTCAFAESILRANGCSTGLFTSPHLVDVRERFRINGELVSAPLFLENFWWCYNKCKEATEKNPDLPMPAYFRFLTLLSLRLFSQLKVDVILLEVGIGGRFDATNVVTNPAVCGVSTLGFDHMELLGDTLALIAGEKAGIFKAGVPAITSSQEDEALEVLVKRAAEVQTPLTILKGGEGIPSDLRLGLAGSHQRINASLAVALVAKWAERTGRASISAGVKEAQSSGTLPDAFKQGLQSASWPGRCQVVRDPSAGVAQADRTAGSDGVSSGALSFYLDGAHTPESMDVCADWFCDALSEPETDLKANGTDGNAGSGGTHLAQHSPCTRVLLFNCMPERSPELLLTRMLDALAARGVSIDFALFAPPLSSYTSLVPARQTPGTPLSSAAESAASFTPPAGVDLSWQLKLQSDWDRLTARHSDARAGKGAAPPVLLASSAGEKDLGAPSVTQFSAVLPSLPAALGALRRMARRGAPRHTKVLVTGSLHLVGDVLRLLA